VTVQINAIGMRLHNLPILSFGLNFERHRPEAAELRERRVRRGNKVRVSYPLNPGRDYAPVITP
jgi:hypothetical protein